MQDARTIHAHTRKHIDAKWVTGQRASVFLVCRDGLEAPSSRPQYLLRCRDVEKQADFRCLSRSSVARSHAQCVAGAPPAGKERSWMIYQSQKNTNV